MSQPLMSDRPLTEEAAEIRAAGAVLWRRGPDGPDVLLIHRPRRDDWSLAKGKREPGEQAPQTAVREVVEETGLRPALGRRLRTSHYLASGTPKLVDYWAAAAPMPDGPTPALVPNAEVDRIEWVSLRQAFDRLSYPSDAEVLDDFAQWPRRTVPLILLRHASAGRKQDWDGDDLLRPLDERGEADAHAIALLLACFEPVRVVTSPAARCVGTVAPYAALIGAAVVADAAFLVRQRVPSGSASRTDAGDPGQAITRLVADGVPTVVCAHGENIPELLAATCDYLGARPPAEPSLPKGSFWVLQASEGRLAGVERYDVGRA